MAEGSTVADGRHTAPWPRPDSHGAHVIKMKEHRCFPAAPPPVPSVPAISTPPQPLHTLIPYTYTPTLNNHEPPLLSLVFLLLLSLPLASIIAASIPFLNSLSPSEQPATQPGQESSLQAWYGYALTAAATLSTVLLAWAVDSWRKHPWQLRALRVQPLALLIIAQLSLPSPRLGGAVVSCSISWRR